MQGSAPVDTGYGHRTRQAGIGDAAPGMAAVPDAYVKTLPRLLVLASSSTAGHPDD